MREYGERYRPSRDEVPRATLYVTGFAKGTPAKTLASVFEDFGPLAQVSVLPPRTRDGQQYGFVAFRHIADMERVLDDIEDGKTITADFALDMEKGLLCEKARRLPVSRRRRYEEPRRDERWRDDRREYDDRRVERRRYEDEGRERDRNWRRDSDWDREREGEIERARERDREREFDDRGYYDDRRDFEEDTRYREERYSGHRSRRSEGRRVAVGGRERDEETARDVSMREGEDEGESAGADAGAGAEAGAGTGADADLAESGANLGGSTRADAAEGEIAATSEDREYARPRSASPGE